MPYKANSAKRPIKRILSNAVYSEIKSCLIAVLTVFS